MYLWTFIVEYGDGSTLVSQVEAADLTDAVSEFNASKEAKKLSLRFPNYDNDELKNTISDEPTSITGTKNVWCLSYVDNVDKLTLANIVKTAR